MIDRTEFMSLARSIVETSFPSERDLFDIEVPRLMDKLERGSRVGGDGSSRIEDQEFGAGDVLEAIKFLPTLIAAYKAILDIKDRRRKKPEKSTKLSDVEIRGLLRKRFAEARLDPGLAASIEEANIVELTKLANS